MAAAYGLEPRAVYGDAPGSRFFCISLGAHRAAVNPAFRFHLADSSANGPHPLAARPI